MRTVLPASSPPPPSRDLTAKYGIRDDQHARSRQKALEEPMRQHYFKVDDEPLVVHAKEEGRAVELGAAVACLV